MRDSPVLLIFLFLSGGLLAHADRAAALTLAAALAAAYEDSPVLEAARADLRSLDENVPIASAGQRPQVGFSTSTSVSVRSSSDTPEGTHVSRSGIFVQQPLYTGGRVDAASERARLAVSLARARLEAREQDVLLAAVETYTDAHFAERRLALALVNRDRSERILQNARDRYRLGGSTGTDVALAETHLQQARAEVEHKRAELTTARVHFGVIIGLPAEGLEAAMEPEGLPPSLDEMRGELEDHPELRAAGLAVELADADVGVADSSSAASMTLNGAAFYVDQPSEDVSMEPDIRLGLVFDVPLYRGGADRARSRQARQARSAREHDFRAERRRREAELVSAHAALESVRQRLSALEARRRVARIAIDGLRQEAILGTASMTDVLDAEETLFETEIDLELLAQKRVSAAYRVLAATGLLSARRLGLDVFHYEPDHHFEQVRSGWFGRKSDDETTR